MASGVDRTKIRGQDKARRSMAGIVLSDPAKEQDKLRKLTANAARVRAWRKRNEESAAKARNRKRSIGEMQEMSLHHRQHIPITLAVLQWMGA